MTLSPDLIIDDASHLYCESRQTFELSFPFLRPGGWYVVEDWGWPHWPGKQYFVGHSALSVLIMELLMLCASTEDIISEVRVFPAFTFIQKSRRAPDLNRHEVGWFVSCAGAGTVSGSRPRNVVFSRSARCDGVLCSGAEQCNSKPSPPAEGNHLALTTGVPASRRDAAALNHERCAQPRTSRREQG